MGIVQNIIGMVRDIGARQNAHNLQNAEANYFNKMDDPAALQAIAQIDAPTAMALQRQRVSDQAAAQDAQQKQASYNLDTVRNVMRGLPQGTDYGAAFDQMAPAFGAMGVDPNHLTGFRQAVVANPNLLMDDKAYEAYTKDQYSNTVGAPGDHIIRGGKVIDTVPYAQKAVTTGPGAATTIFDPNKGEFVTGGGGGGPAPAAPGAGAVDPSQMTLDNLRPLFVSQESGGNYAARNPDTGALGRYQIMPDTGRGLAKKVGVVWNPALMTQDTPVARRYQDALGNAAIQEAIDYGQGDPMKTFGYYYGGPDTSRWGPKTRQYQSDMMGRLNGGTVNSAAPASGVNVSPTSVTVAPRPTKGPITYRAATPEELKGYPAGTMAQMGSDGKLVNIKAPAAASAKNAPSFDKYNESNVALNDLEQNLLKLRNDPHLGSGTGIVGSVMSMIPGTHRRYLQGLVDQINSQKMIGLLQSLQASGGNPFQRVTNMEASTLPKTLGNFDLNQNVPDLQHNIDSALAQVRGMRSRVHDSALNAGVIDQSGNRVGSSAPAASSAAPIRARDANGVLHELIPGRDSSNPANWRTVH